MDDMSFLSLPAPDRRLGRDGPVVGAFAWGMWRFAPVGVSLGTRLIETALDAGVRLFDTADIYGIDSPSGFGSAEALLGEVLAGAPSLRGRMVLATKGGIRPGTPYDSGRLYLNEALDASLRRMQVDHVELYQIHRRDWLTHPAELAETLGAAHRAGKIGAIGVSNYSTAETAALSNFLDLPIISVQNEFSPLHRNPLHDGVLDMAMREGMDFLAWSPLAGGRLISPDTPAAAAAAAVIDCKAEACGVSRALATFGWLLAHPAHPIPIVGSQNPARVAEIADWAKVRWTRAEWYAVLSAAQGEALP